MVAWIIIIIIKYLYSAYTFKFEALDVKESVVVAAVDVSKAFDSVRHSLLLAKLKAHGFSTTATNLIREYLKERRREG